MSEDAGAQVGCEEAEDCPGRDCHCPRCRAGRCITRCQCRRGPLLHCSVAAALTGALGRDQQYLTR